MQGTIAELRSHAALVRFDCACVTLLEGYTDRAYFWHRRFESHSVDAVSHTHCAQHRCKASGSDGQHRGTCGPVAPERKPVLDAGPTAPVAPAPALRLPARKPVPAPTFDDSPVWDSLLAEPEPVGSRR